MYLLLRYYYYACTYYAPRFAIRRVRILLTDNETREIHRGVLRVCRRAT